MSRFATVRNVSARNTRLKTAPLAPKPLGRESCAIRQSLELGPNDILSNEFIARERAEPAIGAPDNALARTHSGNRGADAVRDDFGMFEIVGGYVDDAGDQQHVLRQGQLFEYFRLVFVARISKRDR